VIGSRPSRVVTGSGPDAASAATAGTVGLALWRTSFAHSQYVFLSNQSARRIPWTPGLLAFFHAPFAPALTWGAKGGVLYKRAGQ